MLLAVAEYRPIGAIGHDPSSEFATVWFSVIIADVYPSQVKNKVMTEAPTPRTRDAASLRIACDVAVPDDVPDTQATHGIVHPVTGFFALSNSQNATGVPVVS
jgi:hypothetical protein